MGTDEAQWGQGAVRGRVLAGQNHGVAAKHRGQALRATMSPRMRLLRGDSERQGSSSSSWGGTGPYGTNVETEQPGKPPEDSAQGRGAGELERGPVTQD